MMILLPCSVIGRKWIISYFNKVNSEVDFVKELLRKELAICQRAAEMYPDNYTAWSHRGWVVDTFMAQKPKVFILGPYVLP